MSIPIRNVYYLLCYAWDALQERKQVDVDLDGSGPTVNLLGRVLEAGVTHLLKRGLGREYVTQQDTVAGIRGKLELGATLKRNLLAEGRTVCAFDELHHDVLSNQILKATLRRLLSAPELDPALHGRLLGLHRRLHDISSIDLTARSFRTVQLHRNASVYLFLMSLCRLVYDNLLLDEETGQARFRDFVRDERQMAALFEQFVFRFYHREQSTYKVRRPHLHWQAEATDEDRKYLPVMRTDVVLRSSENTIVLDTKFYRQSFVTSRAGSQPKVHSSHLYQILAYLKNYEPEVGVAAGILLYPTIDQDFTFTYRILGHLVRVCSVNLMQPWLVIHHRLLEVLNLETAPS